MPKYEGKKTVYATPMSKCDFCIQHKNITIDESKENEENQPGYLVVYEDGYKSWSPQKTFESAYRRCESPLDRLQIERDDVMDKYNKLVLFLGREDKEFIAGKTQVDLMEKQKSQMHAYLITLSARIGLFSTAGTCDSKQNEDSCTGK